MDLVEIVYQRMLEKDPTFSSLVDSGEIYHAKSARNFIRSCIENVETKTTMFARLYSTSWSKGSNSASDLSAQSLCVEQYSMQCFKERATILSQEEEFLVTDSYQVSAGAHRVVLKAHHLDLVNGLELLSSTLLDDLVANHLMEDSDVKSIVANTTSKSRAEAFLRRVHLIFSAQTFLDSFLPVLSKYDADVAKKLAFSLQSSSLATDFSRCYNCQMKATVEPALLADVLFTNGIIGQNLHHDLRNVSISDKDKWERLSTEVKDPRDIVEVLRMKFPKVYEEFDMANAPSFNCWCDLIITQPNQGMPSSEDVSVKNVSDDEVLDENMDVANLADLESVLEQSDGDSSRDDISVLTTDWSELSDLPEVRHQSDPGARGEMARSASNREMDANDTSSEPQGGNVCETSGTTSLNQDGAMEIIYTRDTAGDSQQKTGQKGNKSFRQTIKIFLDKYFSRIPSRTIKLPAPDYTYDAFIIYTANDMVSFPFLRFESEHGLKLCIHERDFEIGSYVVENIAFSLEQSRKFVVVLSPALVESSWGMFEYQMATRMSIERNSKVILVKYGDVSFNTPRSLLWRLRRWDYLNWNKGDPPPLKDLAKAIKE